MEELLARREPIYAEADLIVESENGPHGAMVDKIMDALRERDLAGP